VEGSHARASHSAPQMSVTTRGKVARPRGRRRRFGHRYFGLAVSLAVVLACSTLSGCATGSGGDSSGGSGSTSGADATSASGVKFYQGKTITFIVPGAPGKGSANFATAIQSAMAAQLHATINIEYVTGADVVGQDQVWHAQPDGLTIGALTVISDINNSFTKNEALAFSLTDAAKTSVGASYSSPGIFVSCNDPSIKNFAQLLSGKTQLKWVDVTTGGMNLSVHLLMTAYPVPHTYLNGYTSSTATVGCERGDGNASGYPVGNFLDSSGTKLIPSLNGLLLTDSMPSSSPAVALNNSVPTLKAFAEQHPPKTSEAQKALSLLETYYSTQAPQFAVFGPPGIPQDRMDALSAALKAAMAEPQVQASLAKVGIPAGYVGPGGIQAYINTMVSSQDVAIKALAG